MDVQFDFERNLIFSFETQKTRLRMRLKGPDMRLKGTLNFDQKISVATLAMEILKVSF